MNKNKPLTWNHFKSQNLGGGLWLTLGCRAIAQPFAYLFYRLGVSPNKISFAGLTIRLLALVLIVLSPVITPFISISAVILLLLGYIFDCADGQLARAAGLGSKFGEWLDHTLDCVFTFCLHFAAGYIILVQAHTGSEQWYLGFIALVANLTAGGTFSFAWNMKLQLFGKNTVASEVGATSMKVKLMKLPLQGNDPVIPIALFLVTYDNELFTYCYFTYGIMSLLICLLYLLVSAKTIYKMQ